MPDPDGRVDLRSDTVTRPTGAMRRAMAAAEVGDDVYGEDPTINRLQELAAARLGQEAALFVPSGTMANQVALRVLGRPSTEVLCLPGAHLWRYELAASAGNTGLQLHPVPDRDGVPEPEGFAFALADSDDHTPPVSLVALENTYMPAHGRPLLPAETSPVVALARERGIPVHLDGARIWNAAVALEIPAAELAAGATTVMFCVSKGLGAPVGSLLCGPADLIGAARAERRRLGGGMRQAGVLAAAGIVALETGVERLAEDHARARRLAEALGELFPGAVDPARVRTNIVCVPKAALPEGFAERLEADGVRVSALDPATFRLCTHRDVDDADLDRTEQALRRIAKGR